MEPINFPEANGTHEAPSGMTEEQCGPAPSWTGEDADGLPLVICCWKPTDDELYDMIIEGCVYVGFVGGTVVPHMVFPKNPFGREFSKTTLSETLTKAAKKDHALRQCLDTINRYDQDKPTSISSLASYQTNTLQEVKTLLEQALGETQ